MTEQQEKAFERIKDFRASLDLSESEWQVADALVEKFTEIVEMHIKAIRLCKRPRAIVGAALATTLKFQQETSGLVEKEGA